MQLQRLFRTTPGPIKTVNAAPEAHRNSELTESITRQAVTRGSLNNLFKQGTPVVSAVVAEGHATPEALIHLGTGHPQCTVVRRGHPTCGKGSTHLTVSPGEILDVRAVALLDERL